MCCTCPAPSALPMRAQPEAAETAVPLQEDWPTLGAAKAPMRKKERGASESGSIAAAATSGSSTVSMLVGDDSRCDVPCAKGTPSAGRPVQASLILLPPVVGQQC